MKETVKILGISGSLREGSYNSSALRAAASVLPDGAELEIIDISGIPMFNQDAVEELPEAVVELKRKIAEADALLFATPEYNYSVPGVLKNVLDWGSRPYGDNTWDGKPAAIMGASTGILGTARAQYHLRQVFVALNILVINRPEVMITHAAEKFDESGNLTDEQTLKFIRSMVGKLVDWTRKVG